MNMRVKKLAASSESESCLKEATLVRNHFLFGLVGRSKIGVKRLR
jgi:hypothetical protein